MTITIDGTSGITLPSGSAAVGTTDTQSLNNKTIGSGYAGSTVTSGTTVASTSGTSITFTGIPSWVKRVTVMFNGVSTSGSSDFLIQIGAGSVTTTGYNALRAYSQTAAAITNVTTTSGIGIFAGGGASSNYFGSFTVTTLGSNNWVLSGLIGSINNTIMSYSTGGIALGGTLDRIRITTVNGTDTFDAGSINILYE